MRTLCDFLCTGGSESSLLSSLEDCSHLEEDSWLFVGVLGCPVVPRRRESHFAIQLSFRLGPIRPTGGAYDSSELTSGTVEEELGGLPFRFAVCLPSSGRMVVMVLDLVGLNIADLVTMDLPLIIDGFRSTVVSLLAVVGFVEGEIRPEVPVADSRC